MNRWKLYFAYAHLPPHLQAVSKPFHDLAVAIVKWEMTQAAFMALRSAIAGIQTDDPEEITVAQAKLNEAWVALFEDDPTEALRPLLEAKDCAVRAHIPDPPEGA